MLEVRDGVSTRKGSPPRETYAISATASDIAAFFGRAMPESGWFKHGVSTETVLFFQKGNLMSVIIIGDGKFSLMGESDPSTSPVAGSSISEDVSVPIEPNMSEDNQRDAASITDVAFELKWTETGNDHVVIFLESNLPDNAQVRISAENPADHQRVGAIHGWQPTPAKYGAQCSISRNRRSNRSVRLYAALALF